MRMRKPAAALAVAAMMTLAACGGGSDSGSEGEAGEDPTFQEGGAAGSFKNPDVEAPMAVPEDASEGGTLTVLTAVYVAPEELWTTYIYWIAILAVLLSAGPGALSFDALIRFIYQRDKTPEFR